MFHLFCDSLAFSSTTSMTRVSGEGPPTGILLKMVASMRY